MKRYKQANITGITAPAVQVFKNPDLDSKPMARMWFPDAGAGADDNDCILDQFQIMSKGGMGGVEIALLADGTGLADGDNFGWGTPNWVNTLKKVMKAARAIEGGFKVDFTITAHWPPIIYTIDPNDAAASTDLVFAYKKITAADVKNGKMSLPLPEVKLRDSKQLPFIFESKFVGASVAVVSDVPKPKTRGMGHPPETPVIKGPAVIGAFPEGDAFEGPDVLENPSHMIMPEGRGGFGGGPNPFGDMDENADYHVLPWRSRPDITLVSSSLLDVSDKTSKLPDAGWAAGVPDKAALEKWYGGEVKEADVEKAFGPPADESDMLPDGKRDSLYHKKRMADWQDLYETDLTGLDLSPASDGEEIKPGDTILIGFYYRGSGQALSGGSAAKIMPNATYVTNYLIPEGTYAITDFWDKHILSDPELMELVKLNGAEVGGAIFEDSIELSTYGAAWSSGFDKLIPKTMGYEIGNLLPVIAGFATDDTERDFRVAEDFGKAVAKLYKVNHVGLISKWCKGFNYSFRAQAYSLHGLGVVEASLATDVTEGDNSTYNDGLRQLQTVVNVKPDEKFLSMESNTFNKFGFSWISLIKECNWNASGGVNRVIFHGSAYPKSYINHIDWWPGWNWGESCHAGTFMAWDARNTWWDDALTINGYLARMQAVLQNAKRKVDVGILPCIELIYDIAAGNSHQLLLDKGLSYNLLDENVLLMENAVVSGGVLFPDGPSYRVLLMDRVDELSEDAARKVIEMAQAGLPVICLGGVPNRVFGTSRKGNEDSVVSGLIDQLLALDNVKQVKDDAGALEAMEALGVAPAASYSCEKLECSHLSDGKADYYFFYNDGGEDVSAEVSVSGKGNPVFLDCWSGEVYARDWQTVSGGAKGVLTIAAGDIAIVALTDEAPAAAVKALKPAAEIVPDSFSLSIDSFGPPMPGDEEFGGGNPTRSHRTLVDFGEVDKKTNWADLKADEKTLELLRVPSMKEVAGVGTYTTTFTLPKGVVAADLKLAHHRKDVICGVCLNGVELGAPDCMTDVLPLDKAIREGENTLTLRLAAMLNNRLFYNDSLEVKNHPDAMNHPMMRIPIKINFDIRADYGLYTAAIVPYTE